jgi:hypothetical protein
MSVFTTHLKPGKPPVVVREGFTWWGALLGWLWLLWHRAWVAAAIMLMVDTLVGRLSMKLGTPAPGIGLFFLQGLFGWDLVRFGLARRGYAEGPPVVADTRDGALARLLTERTDLLRNMAGVPL